MAGCPSGRRLGRVCHRCGLHAPKGLQFHGLGRFARSRDPRAAQIRAQGSEATPALSPQTHHPKRTQVLLPVAFGEPLATYSYHM